MPDKKLPSPLEAQLLALVVKERSGLEIAEEYGKQTKTELNLGSMYVVLRRLTDAKWAKSRYDKRGDRRLRYFKISASGYAALQVAYEQSDKVREMTGRALGRLTYGEQDE